MSEIKEKNKSSKRKTKTAKLQEEIDALRLELDQMKEKYLRLLAEFENYRKRTAKENMELRRSAAADVLHKLLAVLDDFDRAKKLSDDANSTENFTEGVELVYNKLHQALQQIGLEKVEPLGEHFDPEHHEAITRVPVEEEEKKGKIVDTIEKGYKLNDKVLRHPKVVVGH